MLPIEPNITARRITGRIVDFVSISRISFRRMFIVLFTRSPS